MKSVLNNEAIFLVNKSKFITLTYNVNTKDEADKILSKVKLKYNDATHVCYAYIIGSIEKCYDDNEPSGTAGMPILNVLKRENLDNVLCIVVRYFGGIKLGAGGLLRAYSNACKNALIIVDLKKYIEVSVVFSYDDTSKINHLLKNFNITSKYFDSKVTYIVNIDYDKLDIIDELNKISDTKKLREIYL